MKKFLSLFISVLIFAVILIFPVASVYAANPTIYETEQTLAVTKGVTYKKVRQVTEAGLRDVYILTVDITDSNITLGPAESQKEYSLKEPLTELLIDNKAIAGVNGDFFGMSGTHSLSFGPVVKNGSLISFTSGINSGGAHENASFFISKENNPFVDFFSANIDFFNDGALSMDVFSLNKVTDMVRPIAVNTNSMASTAEIDSRFKDLYKIVVQNGKITYITTKNETVSVPQDGYLIVMNSETANNNLFKYSVGQTAELKIYPSLDLDKIKTAIGGGGRILQEGALSNEGSVATGRHPRTAVGISQDKTKIILMSVDGRTHSVGATHEETAELLKKYGAYSAMHLDGGGSTTMAVQLPGQTKPYVVNRTSDGGERRIISGLGVFNNAPFGEMSGLVVSAGQKNIVYRKTGVTLDVYGTDEYLRRLPVDKNELVITPDDPNGFFAGNLYYPQSLGEITVLATYKDLISEIKLQCRELKEIRPNRMNIIAMEGDEIPLSFVGIDQLGEESLINSPMTFSVVPPSAGVVENGVFKPTDSADGYIQCTLADISCFVRFQIGGRMSMVESFGGGREIAFSSYPDTVTGGAGFTKDPTAQEKQIARLNYNMPESDATSAAYLDFTGGVGIAGEPMAIRARVFGNNSGLWLRGRITDADGAAQNIDFAGSVNWDGWKIVNALIPEGTKFPITLDRVYLVTTQTMENIAGEIYLDTIEAVYPREAINILLPFAGKFQDPLQVKLADTVADTGYDITVVGKTTVDYEIKASDGGEANGGEAASETTDANGGEAASDAADAPEAKPLPLNYTQQQEKIIENITKNAKRALYLGETEMPADIGINVYKWNDNYVSHYDENVTIIQMSAGSGSVAQKNPWQWGNLVEDINASGKGSVIIMLNKNPLNFTMIQELQLFTDTLAELKKSGKNIFVVSADGSETSSVLMGGVRYINLGGLWNMSGGVNENFRILRFRVNGADIRFELERIN
ncbi:MAG: phosphodiester glycosidase family protein [Clostridiales bacterium]|nr:phosphodiester glycosidase family protein [Clostridiales bacterium]